MNHDSSITLHEATTEHGTISVTFCLKTGIVTYRLNGWKYSEATAGGASTIPYIRAMHALIMQSRPRSVASIGNAGGTLATALCRSGCDVLAVDIDPYSFLMAKQFFRMPDSVTCVAMDGLRFLRDSAIMFDAIAVDVYGKDGYIPAGFTTESFFALVRERLAPQAMLVMNVVVAHRHDGFLLELCNRAAASGLAAHISDLPAGHPKNALLIAGHPPSGAGRECTLPNINI